MSMDVLQGKWKDYLFLTIEMKKFLTNREVEMFLSLVDQRENLQSEIDSLANQTFYTSSVGKALLLQIKQANQDMMSVFHLVFNSMKKRENVSQAYGSMSNFAGNHFNSKT